MFESDWFRAASLAIVASVVCLAQAGSVTPAWAAKQPGQWTEEDARQVLSRSPWVREIKAGISRRLTEEELRQGGVLGQPHGVGYDGVDPKGSGPKVNANVLTGAGGDDRSARSLPQSTNVKLSWESALPVRLAELKIPGIDPLTFDGDGYQIAVYGVPGPHFKEDPKQLGEPLKARASLKREGKKDVKPSKVEVFQRPEGLVVVYLFPPSAEIIPKDGFVEFEAHIGRVYVAHTFNLKEMEFMGKLAL
jgi:hypothetical protein